MKLRIRVVEKTKEQIQADIPEAIFVDGNWLGECSNIPIDLNANFWYELREESPSVIYLPIRGADKVSTDRRSKQFASV